jgi:uncharacterized MAPEG superfamily protein
LGRGEAMDVELRMLALSILLGFVHIFLSGHAVTKQYGLDWNVGARDEEMPPLNPLAGRLRRAQHNFFETFPLFAAAVLIAVLAGKRGALTDWGVQLYFWGRLVYLPLYALGIRVVRSLVWTIATIGIFLVLVALL